MNTMPPLHTHDSSMACRRGECEGWASVQTAKRRELWRIKRRLVRTRLGCLIAGGHKWLRMHNGDGSLAFMDCRKCGFRP